MAFEFKLPDIGEGVHEGEIVRWLAETGDTIAEDQPLVEIATDKVTAEIPSPVSGVLKERRGNEGEVIQVGSIIAVLEEGESGESQKSESPSEPDKTSSQPEAGAEEGQEKATQESKETESKPAESKNEQPKPEAQESAKADSSSATAKPAAAQGASTANTSTSAKVLASPATRRLARELGVLLHELPGSGPGGRVTSNDIRAKASTQSAGGTSASKTAEQETGSDPAQSVQTDSMTGALRIEAAPGERRESFSVLRRKIAEKLVKSKQTAAHFAYVEEVEVSQLVALRDSLLSEAESESIKLTYLPFIIKAVIAGLRKYPVLNSQLDEERRQLVYRNDYHIGLAVSAPQGLVVPVIRNAGDKNVLTLAKDIATLADKARNNKLAVEEMQGGTFTISSIGSIGGLFGIPIINYPEVAILGINKIEKRAVVRTINGEDQIVIREMMNLSISCDHRVVDGMEAALFIKEVAACIENPGRVLLREGV
jgi:pyruvate/2-oxoglutarate dehydrogenase complex dihydrolipoamide acyltransferase (E2) component